MNKETKRLIPFPQPAPNHDNSHLGDYWLLMARVVEDSLREAGAEAGKDYGYLDLYRLAQPWVMDEHVKLERGLRIETVADC